MTPTLPRDEAESVVAALLRLDAEDIRDVAELLTCYTREVDAEGRDWLRGALVEIIERKPLEVMRML